MPRRQRAYIGIGGWLLLAVATPHLVAQTPADAAYQGTSPDLPRGYALPMPSGPRSVPTGMDEIRQYPYPGPEFAPTHGYPNYDLPNRFFGVWFLPRFWGLTKWERCAQAAPFKPRGFGNLFARPSTSHRMDYRRPYIFDSYTEYGPSYYVRQPDPNCCARTIPGACYNCRFQVKDHCQVTNCFRSNCD